MANIFISTSEYSVSQHDYHEYLEQSTSTVINHEEDGSVISEPMSLTSSPITTDIQTRNNVHNPKVPSERKHNLCSIYEIRILYATH
jgi:hypothetical protein